MAAVPADAGAVAGLPARHAGADRVDDARDLVAGHARVFDPGKEALLREDVAVADAAGLDPHADLAGPGRRDLSLDGLKGLFRSGDLDGTHRRQGDLL